MGLINCWVLLILALILAASFPAAFIAIIILCVIGDEQHDRNKKRKQGS